MKRDFPFFLLLCLGLVAAAPTLSAKFPDPSHYENEIAAFEAADKTNPPPADPILFTGSSSIRKWTTLSNDFPTHKVLNRGFGGSIVNDLNYFFDRVVLRYKPKMIIVYSGSNDITVGKTPEEVAEDFKTFLQKVDAALPDTKVAFISINAAPSRWKNRDKFIEANRLIADVMGKSDKRFYIDTYAAMLDANGQPRPELYLADRLHLNAKGYAIWTPIIAPYLDKAQ